MLGAAINAVRPCWSVVKLGTSYLAGVADFGHRGEYLEGIIEGRLRW